MKIDLHSDCAVKSALDPVTSTTGAHAGNIIDTAGFESCEFVIQSGSLTDGTQTPSFEHGDASDLSDTADAAGSLLGTIAAATFAATDDNKVKRIGYIGARRYVRLTVTAAGAAVGGPMSAVAILANAHVCPTA